MITKRILATSGLALGLIGSATAAPLAIEQRDITKSTPTYTMEIAYPKTGHAAIDPILEEWAQAAARDFLEMAKDAGGPPGPWSVDVSYTIARNDEAMFAVAFAHGSFTGGAHPNTYSRTFNFLMPDGVEVELPELFTARGMRLISDIAIERLSEDLTAHQVSNGDWIKRGAGPNGRNFRSFVLRPEELALVFDAYQVAAYVAGRQDVTIPLAKLKGTLRADPRAPAASFDCARAQSDVERAICGSRALARLDRHMSEAYAEKLSWARDAAKRDAMRDGQRDWLKARDTACLRAALPLETCLTGMYRVRLRVLEGGG